MSCSPLPTKILHLDGSILTPSDLAANTWRDLSPMGNDVTLFDVEFKPEFGGVVKFKGTNDSYAYRAPINTMGRQIGTTYTGEKKGTARAVMLGAAGIKLVGNGCQCDLLWLEYGSRKRWFVDRHAGAFWYRYDGTGTIPEAALMEYNRNEAQFGGSFQ